MFSPFSQAFGPLERLGQPLMARDARILVKRYVARCTLYLILLEYDHRSDSQGGPRSFNQDKLSVTFFLQNSDEAPFVLIRTVPQSGQPWVCLHGAHELCISRHDNATLNFQRWSRSEGRSKVWASLKFVTWEGSSRLLQTLLSEKGDSGYTIHLKLTSFQRWSSSTARLFA